MAEPHARAVPQARKSPAAVHDLVTRAALPVAQPAGNQQTLRALGIRGKFRVSRPNDPDELEADRTAAMFSAGNMTIQRKCTCCAAQDKDEVCRKPAGEAAGRGVSSPAHQGVRALAESTGYAIPATARRDYEQFFGADFSSVRIHTDSHAQHVAAALDAQAFTRQRDIYFAAGRFDPGSTRGRELLAHELTHTLQGGAPTSAPVRRQAIPGATADATNQPGAVAGPGQDAEQKAMAAIAADVAEEDPDYILDVIDSSIVGRLLEELLPVEIVAALRAETPILRLAASVYRHPELYIELLKAMLAARILEAISNSQARALAAAPKTSSFDASDCIMRHLMPKLTELRDNWWEVLKSMGSELLWPWPGVAGDFEAIWTELKLMKEHLLDGDYSALLDAGLAIMRHFNAAIGRLYGWILIASVLIGAVLGGVAGAAAGGVGAIPGALAGASAGLGVAAEIGYGLLIAILIIEGLSIAKASWNLAQDNRSPANKECDCEVIASSSMTLGISLALMVLGSLASRFAKAIIGRALARVRGPGGAKTEIWDPSLDKRAGSGTESRGDIVEGRFALAEQARVVFRRLRVAITDQFTTLDNFPGIDLTERSNIRITEQATGRVLQSVNELQQAFANRTRVRVEVDGGDVYQVKSHRATATSGASRTQANIAAVRSEISDLANFNAGNITRTGGGPHPVVLTNIASRNLVVFLQEALPAADEAALNQLAAQSGVRLQLVTGSVPPGHPLILTADALPGALSALGSAAEQAVEPREGSQGQGGAPAQCPP